MLTSYLEPFSDTKRGRCEITRFDNNTGELLWRRDYSSIYDGQYVLKNTQVPSDAHWNSLEYVERFNLVIISSRTSSHILMMDATTGDVRYNIANLNSQSPVLSVGQALTPDNLTEFEYGCGQHTVWYTNNPAYASSNTASSMVLTVFDNASCLYSDGVTFQEQPMDDDPTDFTGYDFPTRALVYKIDFDTNKLTLLSSQSFEGRYCEYMGSIYDINNYFCIGLPIKPPSTHVYMDQVMMVYGANKDVGVICEKVAAAGNYRTRIFTYEELKAMI